MGQESKRVKLEIQPRHNRGHGFLYVLGNNNCGQLGFELEHMDEEEGQCQLDTASEYEELEVEDKDLALVRQLELKLQNENDTAEAAPAVIQPNVENNDDKQRVKYPRQLTFFNEQNMLVKEVAAGGMHTAVLTQTGEIYTFGCNDEFALGRPSAEDDDEDFEPQLVILPEKAEQVSAGDSHTVILTSSGVVYAWGAFRDDTGPIGLLPGTDEKYEKEPHRIELPASRLGQKVIQIASGENHFLMLTEAGTVYSVGVSDMGQLGREDLPPPNNAPSSKDYNLTPTQITAGCADENEKPVVFTDIWAGGKSSFLKADSGEGEIWVFGMNATHQLALPNSSRCVRIPTKSVALSSMRWREIAVGKFHCVGLDKDGRVYSWRKFEDGRLGLDGVPKSDVQSPTIIPTLENEQMVHVACGDSVSYALSIKGQVYAWGFGVNCQLGNGDDKDSTIPKLILMSPNNVAQDVIFVSGGGQHACLITSSTNS